MTSYTTSLLTLCPQNYWGVVHLCITPPLLEKNVVIKIFVCGKLYFLCIVNAHYLNFTK